jgi:hypothetical protein
MRRHNARCQRVSAMAVGVGSTQARTAVSGEGLRIPWRGSTANPDHDRSAAEASPRAIGVNVDGDGHTARSGSIHIVSVGKRRARTERQVFARRRTGVGRPRRRPGGMTASRFEAVSRTDRHRHHSFSVGHVCGRHASFRLRTGRDHIPRTRALSLANVRDCAAKQAVLHPGNRYHLQHFDGGGESVVMWGLLQDVGQTLRRVGLHDGAADQLVVARRDAGGHTLGRLGVLLRFSPLSPVFFHPCADRLAGGR